MGKYGQQNRIQSKSKRNHCIHQCRIQTHPLRTGLCTDRTREREIRKHHLGRNLKENNRMKSILQMYINKYINDGEFMIMDIIVCIAYVFIGIRWIFQNVRLGTFSACTTWKVMGLKLFMLLMVPLALFVYVYFADNLTQRLFLGMLVIILGQIGDYLLFKETQRILINTVKYEMTEEFNKKLAHEKFKFQIRMMGLSVIVFMGIISCLLAE